MPPVDEGSAVEGVDVVASWRSTGLSSRPNGNGRMHCPSCNHENRKEARFCDACGHTLGAAEPRKEAYSPSAPLPASIGAGRYQVKSFLGEGAKKRVYLAHDTKLDRDVAVGLLKTETIDETSLARIRLEARAMARLGDHPRIVTVYDIGEDDGRPYIVSQYMAGGTVEHLLERSADHRLPLDQALRIADQICQALEHAHGRGIVHRDLKPGNVWLTDDGFAKLGDFGLAVTSDRSRVTQEGLMLGTVAYMSPEQALGKPVDARSDLYSLGGMLYEVVTGRPPFVGDDAVAVISQHLSAQPVPPSRYNAEIPQALDALVLILLAKSPGERFESAAALREALKAVPTAGGAPSVAASSTQVDALPAGIFVGRKQELEQLRSGLEDAIAGRGRLFMLVGEPGIGKTRTAEQLATYARLRRAQVLVGRCHEGEGAPAYWPWVQVIRSIVRDRTSTALALEMGSGAAEIAQIVPEVREKLPDLSPVQTSDPEGARFRLFDSVTAFLKNAAKGEPLVLVLDDLHWADKSSLLLLQFLTREMESSRLLVLGTYRDIEVQRGHPLADVLTSLRRERVYERILLRGLPEPDVRALLTALGGQEVPDAFASAIYRETEGNPFFIEEILQHLIEEKIIYRDGGRWITRLRPEEMGIPESVRDVIGRRLNRLSKECNTLLAIASVVGREFGLEALEGASDLSGDPLAAALEPAVEARVIVEVPRRPGRYNFSHALVRETLYGELRSARRLKLHQRIAEVLERLHAENPEDHLAELAYHFLEAATGGGDVLKAVEYSQRAGAHADRQLAYGEAVNHYERALQALDLEKPPDEQRRCELLLALGETCWKAGEFEKARETFRRIAGIARERKDPDLLAQAALGFGGPFSAFNVVAFDEDLIDLLRRALELVPDQDSSVRARLLARLAGSLHLTESRPKLVSLAHQAVDMARRVADRATLIYVLAHARYALWEPANLDERQEMTAELLRLAEDVGDYATALDARYYRMSDFVDRGDIAAAQRELAVMARVAEQVRQPHPLWRFRVSRVPWALAEGRLADADRLAGEAFALRGGADQSAALTFVGQSLFLRREQGRISELAPQMKAVAERARHFYVGQCSAAWCLAETGDRDEAQAALDRLMPGSPVEWRHDAFSLASVWSLTQVCATTGDRRRAALLYDVALPYADRFIMGAGALCFGAVPGMLGVLASTLGDYGDAAQHFERALDMNRPLRLWLGWTQHDYASMLLSRGAAGDREKALSLLNSSIAFATDRGLKLLLDRSLALKMRAEGTASIDVKTSIEAVRASVEMKRPDLRGHAAPDGTVTIMFSDMEGFSSMTERLGDREAHKVIQAHNRIVREQVKAHGGYEVELQGDGFLLAFASASRALQCGVSIQRAFAQYNTDHSEQPLRVRIGLHTGEPIKEADRFFGKTVILAARIASEAQGGEIFVSSLVRELTSGVGEFAFDGGQEVELKGLTGTHGVYELLWDGREARRKPSASRPMRSLAGDAFVREGDYWTIVYDGKSVRLRDVKGLHCIAHLLRHPGQEFHVADLATVGEPGTDAPVPAGQGEHTEAQVTAGLGDAGAILDPQARAQYKERLESLRGELEQARSFNDSGRIETLQEEIAFISDELSAAFGLGGRAKKAADSTERIRKTVTSRIRESVARIQKEHADLGQHFSNAIRTGTFCSYNPEKPTSWQV